MQEPIGGGAPRENFHDIIAVDKLMSTGAVLSSPVAEDDTVYFGSADGNVYAVGASR